MELWNRQDPSPAREKAPLLLSELDRMLTAQIAVAWAGEAGEERRLGWWRSDMISEYGGEDLFRRLLPQSWEWAVLQAAREAARRKDAELRSQAHDPDSLVSLFRLGFETDERLEERLQEHKRAGRSPAEALPALREVLCERWSKEAFLEWLEGHGSAETTTTPAGRRLKGAPPKDLGSLAAQLISALAPLSDAYPLPHYRSER